MPITVSSQASSSAAPAAGTAAPTGAADLFSTTDASGAPAPFASQFEDAASEAVAAQVAASPLLPLHGIRSGAGDTVAGSRDSDKANKADKAGADSADDATTGTAAGAALSADATFAAALQVLAGFTQSQTAQPLPPLPTGGAATAPSDSDSAAAATAPAAAADATALLTPDAALPNTGAASTATTLPDAAALPAALPGAGTAPAAAAANVAATVVGTLPPAAQPLPAQPGKLPTDARARNFAQAATATAAPAKGTSSAPATAAPAASASTPASPSSSKPAASDASASTAPLPLDPLQALATAAPAPAAAPGATPATENNAAATVLGGTNAPSLADLGILAPASGAAKAAGIDAPSAKKDEKDDSEAVSSASDKTDAGFGTVFSGSTAMGLFSENSARLGTTTDISFGNALKAYRNGGGDIASSSSSKGAGETRSRGAASGRADADAALPGALPVFTHAASQAHDAQAAQAPQSGGSDVDEASATRFLDLVKQAVGQPDLATPQRISVELQTPPGETVTVFFSQAGNNGPVRAQLSASDATSLQWLQQQVSTLRDAATGNAGTIVWLPPQLDQSQNRPGRDPRQDGSKRDSNAKGQPRVRSAEDVALADSLFGANGSLNLLPNR